MKKSRFTDSQILAILKQAENGIPVTELCRQHGMSSAVSVYGFLDTFLLIKPRCSRPLSGWPAPLTESCSRGVQ